MGLTTGVATEEVSDYCGLWRGEKEIKSAGKGGENLQEMHTIIATGIHSPSKMTLFCTCKIGAVKYKLTTVTLAITELTTYEVFHPEGVTDTALGDGVTVTMHRTI